MKHSQNQNGQASASDPKVETDVELSDDMLDAITGGGSDGAISMQNESNAVPADTEHKSINDLVSRVVSKNFA